MVPLAIPFVVVGLLVGGVILAFAWRVFQAAQRVEAAPWYSAEAPGQGLVKFRGRVQAAEEDALLVSPLTARRCVYYRLIISERRTEQTAQTSSHARAGGSTTVRWVPIVEDEQSILMAVVDDGGSVTLSGVKAAQLDLPRCVMGSGALWVEPAVVDALTERYKLVRPRLKILGAEITLGPGLRYTETTLQPEQEVLLIGRCPEGRFEPLTVTHRSLAEYISRQRTHAMVLAALGGSVFLGVLALIHHSPR